MKKLILSTILAGVVLLSGGCYGRFTGEPGTWDEPGTWHPPCVVHGPGEWCPPSP